MLKSVTTESIHPSVLRIEFPRFYEDAISSVPYIAGDLALTEIMHVAVEQMRWVMGYYICESDNYVKEPL